MPRGSTIYYKGYVTNDAGTILSAERSFSNVPVFTGTGTWASAANWTNSAVPGAGASNGDASVLDSPIINGTCTLASDITCTNLTINPSKRLYIAPQHSLTVNGTLVKDSDTLSLVIKSDTIGTGSLMHNTNNIAATVQRYVTGSATLTLKKYHLVSVPITGDASGNYESWVWLHSFLFTYTPLTDTWFPWDYPTNHTLSTHVGAMVYYTYPSKVYSIAGTLNNGSYSPTISAAGNGYNLIPNPYPSAINWNAASGWTKTNIGSTIWGFSATAGNYGSWNGSTGTNSVTNIIPVGQAFFVIASGSPVLTMNNSVRLNNNTQAFLKSATASTNILHLVAAGNGGQDEIALQFAADATNSSADKYDAIKFYGTMSMPQLSSYTASDANLLSISGLPAIQSSSVVPLRFNMDFTGEVVFTANGVGTFNETSIQLEDKQLTQMIDLNSNPVYTFYHTPTDALDRFVLHFSSIQTGIAKPGAASLSKVTTSGNEIYLHYPSASSGKLMATVYDLQGRVISQVKLSGTGNDHISIRTSGAYLVKLNLSSGVETHKIVVL